ncbi:hypothetical protein ACFLTM_04460 [Candidatus Bipolaricaulota bacterium]
MRAFEYCVMTQAPNGAYPYFDGDDMVYIPYHALQIWHLCIASRQLWGETHPSITRAVDYVQRFVRRNSYAPTNKKKSPWIAKTPLWIAMALLKAGQGQAALRHYCAALALFWNPKRSALFYTLDVQPRLRRRVDSVYPRYVASAFEIGSTLTQSTNTRSS